MKTDVLEVAGASLYYEVRGSGPVLLFVCGGVYDAEAFAPLAERFADRYTVVTYDRRGNSRSPLDGPPEAQRIETHAEDARRLLEVVSPGEAADVFGNSSGAIIALELAARHPELVRTVVAHEPPLFDLLPNHARWGELMDEVEATFRAEGAWPALEVFNAAFAGGEAAEDAVPDDSAESDELGPGSMAEPSADVQARMQQNFEVFIGYEVPSFAKYRVELGALSEADVVVGVGSGSKEEPWARAARVLAERLGHQAVVFPGDHGGFGSEYEAFAVKLAEVLRAEG
ncbi:alpha/beta fold hydrolase [Kribbella sp. ALI-6-A]|uniref:alpha/beta fold hydrolase n=1 Tax=Kribbella sp. ALI-6-A TaxID=1933817 RepID=UPI00192D1B8F|nr:alpha/beta hydrolase [Kribbella sp. ALI-6-A]